MSGGPLDLLLSGAIVMGYAVCALFFLRFWRQTRDRLFPTFALAFLLLAVQRAVLTLTAPHVEWRVGLYTLRLGAFLLILGAIVDKNRSGGAAAPPA
jgi:hypothetical protein